MTKPSSLQLYVSELVQKLYHLSLHQIGSGKREDSQSSSRPHQTSTSSSAGGTLKSSSEEGAKEEVHPNFSPLIAALESDHAFYFVSPYLRFTLFDSAMHSPAMLEDSIAKPLFVLYQLLSLLQHCHSKGATLGDLNLRNVFIDARLWVQARIPWNTFPGKAEPVQPAQPAAEGQMSETAPHNASVESDHVTPSPSPIGSSAVSQAGSTNTLTGMDGSTLPPPPLLSYPPLSLHLCEATQKWRVGELTNFDYLMLLNQHAGRVVGDPNNHPIFPWVMEFTHKDGGYRDLTKSKYRLNKGDRQLDFTFISAQEELRRGQESDALVPHHIGDISSDVTYYVYLARKTPKEVLCSRVRPQWVPKEYPSSVEKMYVWSPDECIPEFYVDHSIFKSIHADLPDLAIPEWAGSVEEFVRAHRAVLEGDAVSANLHHWIDLMFGYKLTGHDAVRAKNVYVSLVDKHKEPLNCGIVQLFKSSHPKRLQTSSAPLAILSWNTYLNMSSMVNASTFSIDQTSARARHTSPEPSDQKTLESIIIEQAVSQQNGTLQEEGPAGDGQDEDLINSFEHVGMEDVKTHLQAVTPGPAPPSTDVGINYEEPPTLAASSALPLSKSRGESVVMPLPTNRFRVPVVNMIFNRQRNKGNVGELDAGYDWQQEKVSFPKEASILHRISKLEDMAHFAFKSCKDDGALYKEQWKMADIAAFDVGFSQFVENAVANAVFYLAEFIGQQVPPTFKCAGTHGAQSFLLAIF